MKSISLILLFVLNSLNSLGTSNGQSQNTSHTSNNYGNDDIMDINSSPNFDIDVLLSATNMAGDQVDDGFALIVLLNRNPVAEAMLPKIDSLNDYLSSGEATKFIRVVFGNMDKKISSLPEPAKLLNNPEQLSHMESVDEDSIVLNRPNAVKIKLSTNDDGNVPEPVALSTFSSIQGIQAIYNEQVASFGKDNGNLIDCGQEGFVLIIGVGNGRRRIRRNLV